MMQNLDSRRDERGISPNGVGNACLIVTVLILGLFGCGRAEPLDCTAAVERKDHATAYRQCSLRAEKGDAVAQYYLGWLYRQGLSVPQDDAEALKWYRQAADQNEPRAQYNLGFMYAGGHGVAQDDAEAVAWYTRAAEHDLPRAQFAVGFMYANGRGLPQDDAEAAKWFRRAAGGCPRFG